ncbi:glucosyltransferase domain-containing protein [Gluconobacter morbifer]|uniref:Glycosyltransferase RgtA/B/C/D-like domain-containing protein n=1 Tax=Gluconobacter morbifer G707 TaxID=1088869 RepID=G6XJL9_9PROT|nr:glucosyltransferase domain-containing protein [Gluconobacter morbifer]EHH67831.1 hypothetical protein GMO_15980 [Gluconobacter morbifer G707]
MTAPRNSIAAQTALVAGVEILFFFPIALANCGYMDDNARVLHGYAWGRSGRIFSTLLMNALDLRVGNIQNIAPLGQFLGLLALSLTGVWLARRLSGERYPDSVTLLLCALPLVVQPFFLENLSYQFDALPMLLAQSCAVLAIGRSENDHPWRQSGTAVALLFSVMAFYQPAINTFVAVSLVVFLRDCQTTSIPLVWRCMGRNMLALLVAAILYHVLITRHFVHGSYEDGHAVMRGWQDVNTDGLLINLSGTMALLRPLLTPGPALLLGLFYAVGTVYAGWIGLRCIRERRLLSVLAGSVGLLVPVMLVVLLSGIILLLKYPIYEPRIFMSFSACLLLGNLAFLFGPFRKMRWFAALPVLYFLVLSYSYGNALKEQTRFENAQIQRLAGVLDDAGFKKGDDLFIYGDEASSPVVRNAVSAFPVLARLLPRQGLHDDDIFGFVMFRQNGVDSREHTPAEWSAARQFLGPATLVRQTPSFALYHQGHAFDLVLKQAPA